MRLGNFRMTVFSDYSVQDIKFLQVVILVFCNKPSMLFMSGHAKITAVSVKSNFVTKKNTKISIIPANIYKSDILVKFKYIICEGVCV